MSILHLNQIESGIRQEFTGKVDLSDIEPSRTTDIENAFLTRGLAAYTFMVMAHVETKTATDSVVDGFQDNGIDLIYHDEDQNLLYILQSKWNKSGTKGIELGEVHKFISGIKDIFKCSWSRFNARLVAKKEQINDALRSPGLKIIVAICQTSNQSLSTEAQHAIDDFIQECNDTSEMVTFELFDQKRLYESLLRNIKGNPVDVAVTLSAWGYTDEPHYSIYGQIGADVLSTWFRSYGKRLMASNIRYYKGTTDVNDAIRYAAEKEAGTFFFLNNGITAVCEEIEKIPLGTGSKQANFFCKGLSIVNGAQTVGSLAAAYARNPMSVEKAKVFIKIISLQGTPEEFGNKVTVATNTQNRIELSDFASLDEEQIRLHQEMWLAGKKYAYKTGDARPSFQEGCTLADAAVALGCAYPDNDMPVLVKTRISDLWNVQDSSSPYRKIFNRGLTSTRLWRCVEVMRIVDECLDRMFSSHSDKDNLVIIHGNRFILHQVFRMIDSSLLNDHTKDFDSAKSSIENICYSVAKQLISSFSVNFPGEFPGVLFKNYKKCRVLNKEMENVAVNYSKIDTPFEQLELGF